MGILGDGVRAGAGIGQAGANRDAARANKEQQMAFAQALPWEPAYASQRTPTYQQTQSPVARKYLESILTGTNPATTFSGSPNAAAVKAYQGQQGDAMYGSDAHLTQQGAEQRARTPYRITSRPSDGMGPGASASAFGPPTGGGGAGGIAMPQQQLDAARFPSLAKAGLTVDQYRQKMGMDPNAIVSDDSIAAMSRLGDGKYLDHVAASTSPAQAQDEQFTYTLGGGRSREEIASGKNTKSDGKKKWGHGRFKQIFGG